MDESLVCCYCGAESCDSNEGWKPDEFGDRCPECVVLFPDDSIASGEAVGLPEGFNPSETVARTIMSGEARAILNGESDAVD